MESKIEKIEVNSFTSVNDGVYLIIQKINEFIDYLNSQAQPVIINYPINSEVQPEERKSICDKHHKEICRECMHNGSWTFEDTLEEWEKRYVKRFGYWGEEIKFIKQLLEEREREAKIEVLTEIFQTCYQEDSKTLELVEEKLAKLKGNE